MKIKHLITAFCLTALLCTALIVAAQLPQEETASAQSKVADVYLIAGQSNAAGSTLKTSTPSGLEMMYNPTDNVLYYGGTHKTVTGGMGRYIADFRKVQHGCGFSDNHVGFELGMANVLNEMPEYSSGEKTAIIFKSAAGGTSVFDDDNFGGYGNWYPKSLWKENYYTTDYNNIAGFQYRAFISVFKEFMLAAKQIKGYDEINIKGLFWMQGESDRDRVEEYVTVCSTLFEDFRADISEITNQDYSALPIYVGEISRTFAYADKVNIDMNLRFIETQYQIASRMQNVYVVPLKDYLINDWIGGRNEVVGSDGAHWNYNDIVSIGQDFMTVFKKTDGIITESVDVNIIGTKNVNCNVIFSGEYGSNYGKDTEKMQFKVNTVANLMMKDISVKGAKMNFVAKEYEGDSIAPTYLYELTDLTDEVVLDVEYAANKVYRVNVSSPDENYGTPPNKKMLKNAYKGCKYQLKTFPYSAGAVLKFIINGVEIYAQKGVNDYVFEDLEEKYLSDGETTLNIEIIYGEKAQVEAQLDAYYNSESNSGGEVVDNDNSGGEVVDNDNSGGEVVDNDNSGGGCAGKGSTMPPASVFALIALGVVLKGRRR